MPFRGNGHELTLFTKRKGQIMTQQLSRRLFLAGTSAAASAGIVGAANAQTPAGGAASVSVQEALKQRRSTKRFGRADVPRETVLEVLWAANGVNRPDEGKTTAPAWHGSKDVDIYVALEDGVSLYNSAANTLESGRPPPAISRRPRQKNWSSPHASTRPSWRRMSICSAPQKGSARAFWVPWTGQPSKRR